MIKLGYEKNTSNCNTEEFCGGLKVEEVVDELEGNADVPAVLECGLDGVGVAAGEDGVGLAAVGDQGGRLVERLVEVQLEALGAVVLVLELLEFA